MKAHRPAAYRTPRARFFFANSAKSRLTFLYKKDYIYISRVTGGPLLGRGSCHVLRRPYSLGSLRGVERPPEFLPLQVFNPYEVCPFGFSFVYCKNYYSFEASFIVAAVYNAG